MHAAAALGLDRLGNLPPDSQTHIECLRRRATA
jgi:hypothetical protein